MNVRQIIHKNKLKQIRIIYPMILLSFLPSMVLLETQVIQNTDFYYFMLIGMGVFLTTVFLLYKKAMCPKCNFNFYQVSVRERKKNQVNYCPGCGLNLDSELE